MKFNLIHFFKDNMLIEPDMSNHVLRRLSFEQKKEDKTVFHQSCKHQEDANHLGKNGIVDTHLLSPIIFDQAHLGSQKTVAISVLPK